MRTKAAFDLAGLSRATEERDAQYVLGLYPDGTHVLCSCTADLRDGFIGRRSIVQVWDK
jgi:hypothetical protein